MDLTNRIQAQEYLNKQLNERLEATELQSQRRLSTVHERVGCLSSTITMIYLEFEHILE